MSYLNFSRTKFIKYIETSEQIQCGSYKIGQSGELAHLYTGFYIKGLLAGTEEFRTKVYLDQNNTVLYATSGWSKFSDATAGNFIGIFRSDFNWENINPFLTYWIGIELQNYTAVGETFWIGAVRDFPDPIYEPITPSAFFYRHPMANQIFLRVTR